MAKIKNIIQPSDHTARERAGQVVYFAKLSHVSGFDETPHSKMYKINIKSNQDANTHNLTNAKRRGQ